MRPYRCWQHSKQHIHFYYQCMRVRYWQHCSHMRRRAGLAHNDRARCSLSLSYVLRYIYRYPSLLPVHVPYQVLAALGPIVDTYQYPVFLFSAKMPLSGLCALWRCGLACCGRHGERRCAPGAGEKPVAFCRTLVLFSKKGNSRNCVWVAGGLSPCECVC